jgi:hypothetical protein
MSKLLISIKKAITAGTAKYKYGLILEFSKITLDEKR